MEIFSTGSIRQPLLNVRNLSVVFKSKHGILKAIDNVSFSINEGEILGLAGESGCGKTLTALSIPGLLPPRAKITNGEIIFTPDSEKPGAEKNRTISLAALNEKEISLIRGREISMVFQEARQCLNPLLKAGKQIDETLELSGYTNKKERLVMVLETLEKLGFEDPKKIYNSYPHQLSGGMCQRILIAIAAISRPKLLITDEPTTALDSENQKMILSLIKEINEGYGTAVLFISHDLSILKQFCHRILVMYDSKIIEEGPAEKILSFPFHPYTKGLLGAVPSAEKKGTPLANIPGNIPSIKDRNPGCPFEPRCPDRKPLCREIFPQAKDLGDGHFVHCFEGGENA